MNNFSIKKKIKQLSAIAAVIIILLLYLTTFILSLMNNRYTDMFFNASLFATVFVPVMLYLMNWMAKVFRSYNPNNDENSHNKDTSKKSGSN